MTGCSTQQALEIRITANHAVEGYNIGLRQFALNIRKVGMYERDPFAVSQSGGLIFGFLEVG